MRHFVGFLAIAGCFPSILPVQGGEALTITSIQRQNDCTVLTWTSRPGEFYTVYWTDSLGAGAFWRVAEVQVPSGGTNTVWSDCEGGQSMMEAPGGETPQSSFLTLSEEEKKALQEAAQIRGQEGAAFLEMELRAAYERHAQWIEQWKTNSALLSSLIATTQGGTETFASSAGVEARFYRIARTAVAGFVDGWGVGLGVLPEGLEEVMAVSAGPRDPLPHSLALRTNGTVVAWGFNGYGQTNVPADLTDVVAIAAGGRHSIAARRDGTVVAWGDNSLGQTNVPVDLTEVVDVKAGLWHNLALQADGTVRAWGDLFEGTNAVPEGLSNVIAIAAGPRDCAALRSDHTVVAWAMDYDFLGNVHPTNVPLDLIEVAAVSVGMDHAQALLLDGTVRAWGRNGSPALAVPSSLSGVLMASAGWHYGWAVQEDATLTGWGQDAGTAGLNAVVALSAGAVHTLVIRTNDTAPVIRRQPSDVAMPEGTSTNISVLATSSLTLSYQWQKDGQDLAGATSATLTFPDLQDSDDGLYRVRVTTSAGEVWSREASVAAVHPPVITNQAPDLELHLPQGSAVPLMVFVESKGTSHLAYRWYRNNDVIPMQLSPVYNLLFNSVAVEGQYKVVVSNIAGSATSQVWTASVTLQGEATGWGNNAFGQLNGDRSETNLVCIAAGGLHSLGLRENGTVVAWGYNGQGQCSIPNDLADVVAIAAGNGHSLALREDGTVVAWGWNSYGQTNVPPEATNIACIAAGSYHNLALRKDGVVLGWGDDRYDALDIPGDLSQVKQLAAGDGLSYALLSNGTVRAWGSGGSGAVSVPSDLTNVVQLVAAYTHALALQDLGVNGSRVVGLGQDSGKGETIPPNDLTNAMQLDAGFRFSVAMREDGTVVAWGDNELGQTAVPEGLGDTKMVAAGAYHALALAYHPTLNYPVDVSQDLLLLYNMTSQDSITVKDYYLAHRPRVGGANVLGLDCPSGETCTTNEFAEEILLPYLQWLHEHPTKRPPYLILMYDVPSRFENLDVLPVEWRAGIAWLLRDTGQARRLRVMSLNMATTNDCIDYIDKLAYFGAQYSPGKLKISPSSGGYGNDHYAIDNVRIAAYRLVAVFESARNSLLAMGLPSDQILYTDNWKSNDSNISLATNVTCYACWGYHGFLGNQWATNGWVQFQGDSNWFIMMTAESWNGQWYPRNSQGSFQRWFEPIAFGGTAYSNTPVGALSHTWEPLCISEAARFFRLWESGKYFAIGAWSSGCDIMLQATGDPFVVK